MKLPTLAKVVIVNAAGDVLLLRRSETDTRRPLEWDLPGGNVEPGEDIRAAVVRETLEEAGVQLTHPTVVYGHSEPRLPHGLPTWIFFAEKVAGDPTVTLSFEHDRYIWLPVAQAAEEVEYPLHRLLLNYLLDNKVLDYI
jgi:8-oxo-dGTP diphosphatase